MTEEGREPDKAYHYALWASRVGETIARNIQSRHPRAFLYRGAALEHSFKKAVYFLLINDSDAFRAFGESTRGGNPAIQAGNASTAEILAEYFHPGNGIDAQERGRVRRLAVAMMDRALEISGAVRRLQPFGNSSAGRPVWAVAIQPKFVGHLLPLMRGLGAPFQFVTFDDPVTEAEARRLGLSCRNIGPGKETVTRGRRNSRLGLVHSHAVAFDAVYRHMLAARPAGVVVPEGNAPIYDVVNEVARQFGVPVVCVQQGWSPIVHSGFRDLRFTSMVVWGDWFAEALAPFNPEQRFAALGHHLIDLHGARAGKPATIGFFLQAVTRLISDDAWQGMFNLIGYAANHLPDARILVRDHPNGPLTDNEKTFLGRLGAVEHLPAGQFPLQQVLERCDIVVSVYSTTILEAIGVGALPLIVNVTSMPTYYPDLQSLGAGIEVKTFEQAEVALADIWSGKRKVDAGQIEAMQRALFSCGGQQALGRIVSHLQKEFGLAAEQNRANG